MSEPIITKRCSKCKQVKELTKFHKNKRKKCGHHGRCKKCRSNEHYPESEQTRLKKILYRKSKRGKLAEYRGKKKWKNNNSPKVSASNAVAKAIISGKLKPAYNFICKCRNQAQEYHHSSYDFSQRLNVIPLCRMCHIKIHQNPLGLKNSM